MRAYNFSAGPSMLFESVLEQARDEMLDYKGTGMSVMEMSHRSKSYEDIHNECISLLRELMAIPENYDVLLLQGGASTQFDAIPLNLLTKGKADYVVTGNFANNAYKAAVKYGDIAVAASSKDKNYTYIPELTSDSFRKDIDYVHITTNNTIFGTRYIDFPETEAPLVADMSSEILSRKIDVSKFGLIYAGAQKNISCAGLTIVIVRKDLMGTAMKICPTMLDYKIQADSNSMYNTCPCYSIYIAMLTFRHIKALGGVDAINALNVQKANMLYDYIDSSDYYYNYVHKEDRSIMNVPFVIKSEELNEKFVKEAATAGLKTLKGHRLVGGMRASIYNAVPVAGVEALITFMKKFKAANS
jgi:phosphoserine aminotransferase